MVRRAAATSIADDVSGSFYCVSRLLVLGCRCCCCSESYVMTERIGSAIFPIIYVVQRKYISLTYSAKWTECACMYVCVHKSMHVYIP